MTQQTLGKLREASGKNYRQVAEEIGISVSGYWQIEHGKRGASYSTMVKLAQVFNTTPDHIFLDKQLTKG